VKRKIQCINGPAHGVEATVDADIIMSKNGKYYLYQQGGHAYYVREVTQEEIKEWGLLSSQGHPADSGEKSQNN
jgi:hypothetical protein